MSPKMGLRIYDNFLNLTKNLKNIFNNFWSINVHFVLQDCKVRVCFVKTSYFPLSYLII